MKPELPLWLENAVVAIKWACNVQTVLGIYVNEMRRQIIAWAGRELEHHEELPDDIHQQLKNAALYNDSLAFRGLDRQSLRTFVTEGKWREAPLPKTRTQAVITQEQRDLEHEQAREERSRCYDNYLREKHLNEMPHLPYMEWKRQHDRRLTLWAEHCEKNPDTPKLPIPPLVGEELDLTWATKRKPKPGPLGEGLVVDVPCRVVEPMQLEAKDPMVEAMEAAALL